MYHKYYSINNGQLLTVCEAIQKFDLTIDEILYSYKLKIIRINRKYTYRSSEGRYLTEEGKLIYDIIY